MACGAGPEMIAPGGAQRNLGSLKEIERARGAGDRCLNWAAIASIAGSAGSHS